MGTLTPALSRREREIVVADLWRHLPDEVETVQTPNQLVRHVGVLHE
jgi:hypothetical protein